ncbi:MAG: tetratricopeptide repeat protein, partial [Acidobacteria bacterium]|nr:tetratricopeptide repeat protein [Acidobacteriota bacterium]
RAEKIAIEAVGSEHPMVASALHNRAEQLRRIGQYAEAQSLYERAQAIWVEAHGPESPEVASSLRSLGELLEQLEEYGPALQAHQRAVAIREVALGPDHPFLALSLADLGTLSSKTGDYTAARAALARSVQAPPFHAATLYGAAPSVVSADALLHGDVLGACDLRIEGIVEGNVVAPNVTVSEGAHVEGSIYAETAHVAGTVNGRIEAARTPRKRSTFGAARAP